MRDIACFSTKMNVDHAHLCIASPLFPMVPPFSPLRPASAAREAQRVVESQDYAFRIDHLRRINAHIKFVSFEPLLGPVDALDLRDVHWAIVGGESGPGSRPMREEWAIGIRDHCRQAKVPFFFKQWGGVNKKRNGRLLDGQTWDEMPSLPQSMESLFAVG